MNIPELCQNSSLLQTIYFIKSILNVICIISPIVLTIVGILVVGAISVRGAFLETPCI